MQVKLLSPSQWSSAKEKITRFLYRYGDSRITHAGLAALNELPPARLAASARGAATPAAVAVGVQDGKLVAVAFAEDGGERACFVVVAPDFRGQGVGSMLLRAMHRQMGRLTCSVASDNPTSMNMCFRAGMKAVSLHTGPTGKPTLRFEH
ncbi:GNAT family N-acetyltransferase [Paenibacillus sacheonensis]|uniref:GNAT family N-acetyltransferase n=1 Tax=Paenibacillus sacheonensis TaxID=742054 RepID=A0A7X4YNK7_9BACL|nr:GNAT family N-acetyltransferase [Paenibacillus sacheonensis]MBM7565405.1 ribosomal protein S18 acetylase RimI-like enzyme [Paenibacillus sacheonensis]NBC69667.1 GNAT family N-acetyltransferase [Paenibacillus sacheonensis]